MGLYEKAKQYMYDKKIEVLTNLERRQFRNVFEEDEHLISMIIKECSYLLKKSEGNEDCINKLISSFIFNNAIEMNSEELLDGFTSLLQNEMNIDSFLFYNHHEKRCVLDPKFKKTWPYGDLKEVFKPSDFDLEGIKERLANRKDTSGLNLISIDFLSLLKTYSEEEGEEFDVPLSSSNVEAFCILDENLKPYVMFVFASKTIDFHKEDIFESLELATFIFYYLYVSKVTAEDEAERNTFAFALKYIERLLDKNSSIYINTFKLKHLLTPKKYKDNYSAMYHQMDAILAETKNIENLFCLGNYHYITIADNAMLSKQHLDNFKIIADRVRQEVLPIISFSKSKVDYPSKRFTNKSEFMDYVIYLIDNGVPPPLKVVKSKSSSIKKSTASKKAVGDTTTADAPSLKKTAAKKTAAKKDTSKKATTKKK